LFYRLKEITGKGDIDFGGINICLIGDLFQLDPVGYRLYKYALHLYQLSDHSSPIYIGAYLFRKFIKKDIIEQMRASEDPRHQQIVEKIRNLDIIYPIDDDIIDILFNECQLTKEDVEKDNELKKAVICVSGNIEKIAYEEIFLKAYAIEHGYPIIKWKNIITSKIHPTCIDLLFSDFYKNNSQMGHLYQSFVPGSKCICLDNLNTSRGMCNGTPIYQHSLVFETEEEADLLNKLIINSVPGEVIILENRPKYVNMSILPEFFSYWDDNTISFIDPITNGRYIPFAISNIRNPFVTFKGIDGITLLRYKIFPYEHNFVCTEFKVQGQTLSRIISVLRDNPTTSFKNLSINGFLVRLSRIRLLLHYKILPVKSKDDLMFLKNLKYSDDLKKFLNAYDKEGKWIDPITDIEKIKYNDQLSDKKFCKSVSDRKKNLNKEIINNPKKNNISNNAPNKNNKINNIPSVVKNLNPKSTIKMGKKQIIVNNSINDLFNSLNKTNNHNLILSDSNYLNYGLDNDKQIWCYFNSAIQMIIHDDDLKKCIKVIKINYSTDTCTERIKLQLELIISLQKLIIYLDSKLNNNNNNNNKSNKLVILNSIRSNYKNNFPLTDLSKQNDCIEFYMCIFQTIQEISNKTLYLGMAFNNEVIEKCLIQYCAFYALQCQNCRKFDNFVRDYNIEIVSTNLINFFVEPFNDIIKSNNNYKIPIVNALKIMQDNVFDTINNVNENCNNCNLNCTSLIRKTRRIIKYNNILNITVQFFTFADQLGLHSEKLSNFIEFPLEFNYKDLELFDIATTTFIPDYKQEFSDNKDSIYSLVKFVEHLGEDINHGHYKCYIRDKTFNVWYVLNDNTVTIISYLDIIQLLNKKSQNGVFFVTYEKNISCIRNKISNNINNNQNIKKINLLQNNENGKPKLTINKDNFDRKLRNNPIKSLKGKLLKQFNDIIGNNNINPYIIIDDDKDIVINEKLKLNIDPIKDNNNNIIIIDDDEPIELSISNLNITYFNFMNLDSNIITNISNQQSITIQNSKTNFNTFNRDLKMTELFRIQGTGRDGWLNSCIIDYFNKLQMEKYKKKYLIINNQNLPFYIFPTYEMVEDESMFNNSINSLNVRMSRQYKFDMFCGIKSHLFFPMNHNNSHWTLSIVNVILKKIYFLDPMYTINPNLSITRGKKVFRKNKLFLKKWHDNFDNTDFNIDEYEYINLEGECPQQTNGFDCGVFGLTYIDSLLNDNYYFSQNDMVNIRKNLLAISVLGKMYK
jgi:hypothetical protein